MELADLVAELTDLFGPSGAEAPVQDRVEQLWADLGLHPRRTPTGNVIAETGDGGERLLVAAHADEISFRVRSVTPGGFLWLTAGRAMGESVPPQPVPLGHPAAVVTRTAVLPGTFVTPTGHVLSRPGTEGRGQNWGEFLVDIGVRSAGEAAAAGVHAGCPVVPAVRTRRVGPLLVGKAMDDRAGLAVITWMLRLLRGQTLRVRVRVASTVLEEVALGGAREVAEGCDRAIAVEVGLAGDVPMVGLDQMPVRLGAGPALLHADALMHYDRALTYSLADAAQRAGLPVQHAAYPTFATDGAEWVKERVPTAVVTFPTRYTHSVFETVDVDDLTRTAELLAAFVRG
ncbi:MAG: M20/M25/M40 family metallo-hydrolase [Armatimonadota bacterium]|nr:M20/M25/M40 family metallo-hydrolase [Armatimonadota bacterium]MDR7454257.1 M20/M25/M40 family metallo-hydrolase [Armatimonadota bacterium]MDR7456793.1 M20/M25/M40 family metallo-hydrolase [Armatimonadota bacterium]MDR7497335.1 M20/M25/M40 family metallo-hydrolase [Armatimonadota bacterium]MDR7511735.1 M20/M25/M40 family metallo-hydrolase [Armatimonadota bacterium]